MMKLILLLFLVLLVVVHQTHGDCQDIDQLCRKQFKTTIPYECDKTCSKFVVCYYLIDQLHGLLKTCPNGMYYDNSHKMCSIHKPAGCL